MVSRERAEMFARDHGMQFIEVSAKTAEGIDEVITMLLLQPYLVINNI